MQRRTFFKSLFVGALAAPVLVKAALKEPAPLAIAKRGYLAGTWPGVKLDLSGVCSPYQKAFERYQGYDEFVIHSVGVNMRRRRDEVRWEIIKNAR